MFIISKIVRGRRLLQEMEENTKENDGHRQKRGDTIDGSGDILPNTSEQSPDGLQPTPSRRKKAVRQKTDTSLPDDATTLDVKTGRLRRTSSLPSVCDDNRYNAEGKLIRHYNYEAKLSKLQKRSLRFTWHRLQTRNGGKRVEAVFEEVFERLIKHMPVMREIFTTRTFLSAMSKGDVATLRDHARVMVRMIDVIIKNLDTETRKRTDTESDVDPRLLGRAHGCLRPYGFNSNFWEKLGEIMVDVVLIQEAVRDLPGAGQAWVVLTACLVDQLRAGFDQAKETDGKLSITSTGGLPMCPALSSGSAAAAAKTNNNNQHSKAAAWQQYPQRSINSGRQLPELAPWPPCGIQEDHTYENIEKFRAVDETSDDSDHHTYVNYHEEPGPSHSGNNTPYGRCPYSGSPAHSLPSPKQHTPRQLPEIPTSPSPLLTGPSPRHSFSLVPDHSVDPIR
uniref:GLOBIN domain-containing protein n=1 Tax=Panagrellus redivivus TaxID=6233 RepID=A0A7E4V5B7_PANRE